MWDWCLLGHTSQSKMRQAVALCVPPKTIQYIPRSMHTVFALLCFVVVIHWLIFPYPSGLLHWHCGNLTIAPVPAKQPWWIWINITCEFIMNDCITTTKQSTTKPCAYFLGYSESVSPAVNIPAIIHCTSEASRLGFIVMDLAIIWLHCILKALYKMYIKLMIN